MFRRTLRALTRTSGTVPKLVVEAESPIVLLRKTFELQAAEQCLQLRYASGCGLKEELGKKIESEVKRIKPFVKEFADAELGKVTLKQVYGGMRGIPGLVCETSALDPNEGIMYRGLSIPEIRKKLPKAKKDGEPLPEGVFWLLCTGKVPTEQQVKALSAEWAERGKLPKCLVGVMQSIPRDLHPMTQLTIAAAALNHRSKFVDAFNKNLKKAKYWEVCYEDSMDLIAKLPAIAAFIYRHSYCDDETVPPISKDLCWSENFTNMLGWDDPLFTELMRIYLCIHCDHGAGNVSAHAGLLVSSALADPFLSYSAAMCGLAGPLHGLANQECLVWIRQMQKKYGENPTEEQVKEYSNETLKSGKVIPGFGHAVLRKTDPRYICQAEFAKKHLPDDSLCKTVATIYKVVPPLLEALGKVQNPWPNVDAHSGALLWHFGMTEMQYYTVLFGVSRSLGVLSQAIWARAMGLPIERPNSFTPDELMKKLAKGGKGGKSDKCKKGGKDKKDKKDKNKSKCGKKKEESKGGKKKEESKCGKKKEESKCGKKKEESKCGKKKEESKCGKKKEESKCGKKKEESKGDKKKEESKCGKKKEESKCGKKKEESKCGKKKEESEGGKKKEESKCGKKEEESEGGKKKEESKCGKKKEQSKCGKKEEESEGGKKKENSKCGKAKPTDKVACGLGIKKKKQGCEKKEKSKKDKNKDGNKCDGE